MDGSMHSWEEFGDKSLIPSSSSSSSVPTQKPRNERITLEMHQTDRPRRTGTLLETGPQRAL
jgi:hypothetical protein